MVRRPQHLPPRLTRNEVRALLDQPSRRYRTGIRNRALMGVMWAAGLRCAETLNLRLRDVDLDTGTIRVNRGKGQKDRIVYIDRGTIEVIKTWKESKPRSDWLFCTLAGERMKEAYVRAMVARYGAKAGIPIRVHPHLLRHTYASEFLEDGGSLIELQQQLGHARLETTLVYAHVSNENLRRRLNEREKW